MRIEHSLNNSIKAYESQLDLYGPTAKGVGWDTQGSQLLRFDKLLNKFDLNKNFTILDYGCGYGALYKYLYDIGLKFRYQGYDISTKMVKQAKKLFHTNTECEFFHKKNHLSSADYVVASGVFNYKPKIRKGDWESIIFNTLRKMAGLSEMGFSFNAISAHSAEKYKQNDIYYADPAFLYKYLKNNYPVKKIILEDYQIDDLPIYEFVIIAKN